MQTLTIKPSARQLYEVQPQHAHPTSSLSRVLYVKFLRWVDKASAEALRKLAVRIVLFLALAALVMIPNFFLGFVTAAAKWNGFRLPIFATSLVLCCRAKHLYRYLMKPKVHGNQHTYHGLPIDELASYLIEQQKFIRDEAMRKFGISQEKHQKIAEELEKNQVLVRGDNNARVLNTITREQLVRQLTEKFPLAFHDGEWAERKGSYEIFLRDKERAEQKEVEQVERLERKRDRLKDEVSVFQRIVSGEVA